VPSLTGNGLIKFKENLRLRVIRREKKRKKEGRKKERERKK